jgi:hypothetical protein
MPKLLRQAHDAELIDLSRDDEGSYAVRVRQDEPAAEATSAPVPALEPVRETRPPQAEEEYEPPQPASSAPPPPYSQSTGPGGMPMRSARFRRGSRGPRPAAPDVNRVGVVEVDPNFRSRVERMPPRSGPAAPVANEPPSVGGGGRTDDDHPRRERGGRGRGGRGRGRGGNREGREGNGGHGGREGREGPENRESRGGGEGERSRGRRGGRGRGGRGGGRPDRNGEDRPRGASVYESSRAPEPPAPPPPPTPRPAPPAESREEGDSFWSRVKRGLIGGE